MAKARKDLSKQVESAEDELETAEAAVVAAHEKVLQARARARRLRKLLRRSEQLEDDAYSRELAGIEEVESMEQEIVAQSSVDALLASGELLEFPEGDNLGALLAPPIAWGHTTGSLPMSWLDPVVGLPS